MTNTPYKRAVAYDDGVAMVITDLHGEGTVYTYLRNLFLEKYEAGEVQRLIICGDLIHGYGDEADDASLEMITDVMTLQKKLGFDTVVMVLGNHEMSHIYNVTLSKGNMEFTGRFEKFLAELDNRDDIPYKRADVIDFLDSLPFFVWTKAGVLITHAGATGTIHSPAIAEKILNFDHQELLQLGNRLLESYDPEIFWDDEYYQRQVGQYLSIFNPKHRRYLHLLRGTIISENNHDYKLLWDVLFTSNEFVYGLEEYGQVLRHYLSVFSEVSPYPQKVLVSGHIMVQRGGFLTVGPQQLRMASFTHATPRNEGVYLLLDCAKSVNFAAQLIPHLFPVFQ